MSRAPKPIAGSLKVWRPWQRRQFELFQGITITSSLTHRYSQEYMIVAMQSGAGSLQYRNSREITNAANGIFYVFEPGETWSCQSKDFTFHGFSLDSAWLQQIATEMYQRERSLPHFPSRGLFDPSLSMNLCELAARSQTPVSRLQQEELLLSFAQILLAHAEDRGTLPERGWEHPAVKQAKEYLHAYYTEEITLHALAHVASLSPFHLARVFHQTYGLSPHSYQTQLRLARAKTLLAQGYEIDYVATETGFFDQSHFTQQFKRHFSVTPGSYRKTARFS